VLELDSRIGVVRDLAQLEALRVFPLLQAVLLHGLREAGCARQELPVLLLGGGVGDQQVRGQPARQRGLEVQREEAQ
jgi:hypothetical protein